MSSGSRLHVHMGCGEPLQSRWWVLRPAKALSARGRNGKPKRVPAQTENVRSGDKSKS